LNLQSIVQSVEIQRQYDLYYLDQYNNPHHL